MAKGIEYFYTDDLEAEYKKLSKSSDKVDKEKAEVLKKAIEDAKANGKIKEGQKVQAVLAWIPKFEAPHGSENQFTFKLSNVFVDKKNTKTLKTMLLVQTILMMPLLVTRLSSTLVVLQ